jgi:hypothetical protein
MSKHDVERVHLHGLDVGRHVQPVVVVRAAVVGLQEGAELVRRHDVDRQRALLGAERIALDVPVAVGARPLAQQLDVAADRLERHDRAVVQNLVAQEVVVLADVRADIEHAVDVEARQQLAQVKSEVALLHLAQGHDVVAERTADLEDAVLDDFEHAGNIPPPGPGRQ